MMKTTLCFKSTILLLSALGLQACTPDYSEHIEVLNNIDITSQYALYRGLDDMDKNRPLKSGVLGRSFTNCMKNYKKEWNPGGTKDKYYMEIEGNNGQKYYYTIRAVQHKVKTLSRWKEKMNSGFKSGNLLMSVDCSLNELNGFNLKNNSAKE